MKRRFEGLHQANPGIEIPDGIFLVRVDGARYRWHAQKPYYSLRLAVIEPVLYAGVFINSRVFCTPKALWKLHWFLRDFGYDLELLGHDEIEDRKLVGLTGVVKVSRVVIHGISVLKLDGFAPAAAWQQLSPDTGTDNRGSEVA